MVLEGNPHHYIGLLDRLVEDYEILFDGKNLIGKIYAYTNLLIANSSFNAIDDGNNGTSDPLKRSRSINTGSLSSNASSIRKRFGFGTSLTRENSRSDAETIVGSVWRTLSKNTRGSSDVDVQSSSLSKSFLLRSRSIDNDNRRPPLPRPVSQGRSPSPVAAAGEELHHRPGSTHSTISNLTTIGEGLPSVILRSPRKKRRSSLSDLMNAKNPGSVYVSSPAQLRAVNSPQNTIQKSRISPRTPSPTKLQTFPSMKELSPPRLETFNRKENVPPLPRKMLAEIAVNKKSDETVNASLSLHKRKDVPTGIPTLKPRQQGCRSPNPSPNEILMKSGSSPQKLRLQSPQKVSLKINALETV